MFNDGGRLKKRALAFGIVIVVWIIGTQIGEWAALNLEPETFLLALTVGTVIMVTMAVVSIIALIYLIVSGRLKSEE